MAKKSYLNFQLMKRREGRVTDSWEVLSKTDGSKLGSVQFKAEWRRYVFQSYMGPIFDPDCLRELADFMEGETNKRKEARREQVPPV